MSNNRIARRISRRGISRRRKEVRREQERMLADLDRRTAAQLEELRSAADDWDVFAEELGPELADLLCDVEEYHDASDDSPSA